MKRPDWNGEVEPSAIRYWIALPPDVAREMSVIVVDDDIALPLIVPIFAIIVPFAVIALENYVFAMDNYVLIDCSTVCNDIRICNYVACKS